MRLIFLITGLLISIGVISQTGTLEGNVFYRYNEFVGDRADAGSNIYVVKYGEEKKRHFATVDLNGNYSISNIDTGVHLVVAVSKNTTSNEYVSYRALELFTARLEPILGINIESFNLELKEKITLKHQEYEIAVKSKGFKKIRLLRNELNQLIFDYFLSLPPDALLIGIDLPTKNLRFSKVQILENQTTKLVTSFGTSFY